MYGDPGVTVVKVKSTRDQSGSFDITNDDSETLVIDYRSIGNYFTIESLDYNNTITWRSYDDQHLFEYSVDGGET